MAMQSWDSGPAVAVGCYAMEQLPLQYDSNGWGGGGRGGREGGDTDGNGGGVR